MKFYFTTILLLVFGVGHAQFKEFNFNCNKYEVDKCSPFKETDERCPDGSVATSNWKVSHGSPSVVLPNERWCVLTAKDVTVNNTTTKTGEGIFAPYGFKKGKKYLIEITVLRNDNFQGGMLSIKAATGINAGGTTSCSEEALPTVSQTEDILPIARSSGVKSISVTFQSQEYRPTKDFSQLWVYAEEIYANNSCEYQIEYLTVTDLGFIDGIGPPPPVINEDGCVTLLPTEPGAVKLSLAATKDRYFGYDVAAYGDYIVVGAPLDNVVYVYKKEGCNVVRTATIAGDGTDGAFGGSVDIYSDQIIVGAPGYGGAGGKAYIFKKEGELWNLKIKIPGEIYFGYDVAIDDYNAIIGSPTELDYGMVYFYRKASGGSWGFQFRQIGADLKGGFGKSVDIKKNRAVVGAPDASNHVYVFDWMSIFGYSIWSVSADISYKNVPVYPQYNNFGKYVALNNAENEIAICGYDFTTIRQETDGSWNWANPAERDVGTTNNKISFSDDGNYLLSGDRGWATLYKKNAISGWDVVKYVEKVKNEGYGDYGWSVAITDNFMVIGSPAFSNQCIAPGSVYVYDLFSAIYPDTRALCNVNSTGVEDPMKAKFITIGGESCTSIYQATSSATYYGNSVILKSGFVAKSGSNFKAIPMGCPFDNQYVNGRGADELPEPTKIKSEPVASTSIILKENPYKDSYLTVYPNPSKGNITAMSHAGEIEDLKIYDLQGNIIHHTDLKNGTQKLINIDLGEDRRGMFILQATVDGKPYVEKIIVK